MAFHEVQFPVDISYGSRGGPLFNVLALMTKLGNEIRIARHRNPRREYDVRYGIKNRDQLVEVYKFFLARKGSAHGFRYKDWLDFTTGYNGRAAPTALDQTWLAINGETTKYRIRKLYESGGFYHQRFLYKPVVGTVKVRLTAGGPDLVEGVDFTVDYTTGIVTIPSATGAPIFGGCEFDVPVIFTPSAEKAFRTLRSDFDIGDIQGINLIELKFAGLGEEDSFAYLPPGDNPYPGPFPPGEEPPSYDPPGCPTCGGGPDPEPPNYDPPDDNNPPAPGEEPPPDGECTECELLLDDETPITWRSGSSGHLRDQHYADIGEPYYFHNIDVDVPKLNGNHIPGGPCAFGCAVKPEESVGNPYDARIIILVPERADGERWKYYYIYAAEGQWPDEATAQAALENYLETGSWGSYVVGDTSASPLYLYSDAWGDYFEETNTGEITVIDWKAPGYTLRTECDE